jgi:hypothetical protein
MTPVPTFVVAILCLSSGAIIRTVQALRSPRCWRCGYDVGSAPECPECGRVQLVPPVRIICCGRVRYSVIASVVGVLICFTVLLCAFDRGRWLGLIPSSGVAYLAMYADSDAVGAELASRVDERDGLLPFFSSNILERQIAATIRNSDSRVAQAYKLIPLLRNKSGVWEAVLSHVQLQQLSTTENRLIIDSIWYTKRADINSLEVVVALGANPDSMTRNYLYVRLVDVSGFDKEICDLLRSAATNDPDLDGRKIAGASMRMRKCP